MLNFDVFEWTINSLPLPTIMSYDYNALVYQVASIRQNAENASNSVDKLKYLQESVETFSTLSAHCPMTPLLWMQYSKDMADLLLCLSQNDEESSSEAAASSLDTRLQLLELALSEFPGSGILHLHYLQLLLQDDSDRNRIQLAFASALDNVGKGSHRNEGVLISSIFKLAVEFFARKGETDKALGLFVKRAQTPMKDVNESLMVELEDFWTKYSSDISVQQRQTTLQLVDEARRFESKMFSFLISCEDEVDVAMHQEGILPRNQVDLENLPWEDILRSDDKICWMGCGGMCSSQAFIQYAQTCYRYRVRMSGKKSDLSEDEQQQMKEDETNIQDLALCVFERGVAECPTAESLWLSYIRHLEYLAQKDRSVLSRLKNVAERSVRNCPYSFLLYRQRLELHGFMADLGVSILDPDELQKFVQEAIDTRFLPSKESCLELYMTATKILRRRVLSLLSKASATRSEASTKTLSYDGAESFDPTKNIPIHPDLDKDTIQELEDLCIDCREFYETIDTYLRKNHASWTEGRGRVWSERAYMETHLLGPLSSALSDNIDMVDDSCNNQFIEAAKSYDKLIKVYQPAHPDCFLDYIHCLRNLYPTRKPTSLIAKLHCLRFLYEKAIKNTGQPKHQTEALDPLVQRDFDSGLRNLCHEYLVFERYFGSEKSLISASSAIQKKLLKFSPLQTMNHIQGAGAVDLGNSLGSQDASAMQVDENQPYLEVTEEQPPVSRKRSVKEPVDQTEPVPKKARTGGDTSKLNESHDSSTGGHKVKVGNLEYPAHPVTVRVLDLPSDTEDMDLIHTFRPKCGAIVHARIMREKHPSGKGKSKGWGLIQFEAQESVDKALALSEVIGIREKLVKVDRSHMPAIGLVPPGMHRVNPKGEGKSSKKNQKRREGKGEHTLNSESTEHLETLSKPSDSAKLSTHPTNGMGVLAFKPRGVHHSQKHRKVKIALNSTTP